MSGALAAVFLCLALIVVIAPLLASRAQRRNEDEVDDTFWPTVTVVTPMFNEGDGIRATLRSIIAQEYPAELFTVIVVDDCSTDSSYEAACQEAAGLPHVQILRNPQNIGKRRSINRAVRESSAEVIVSIDSDVIVDPQAVRQLVRRFTNPRIAAVGGRVDIRNKRENWLTRMQAVKYFYGYHFLKNLERAFRSVMCLSGCLTAYRRSVLLELEPVLENRNIMGVAIKYGEDRFLTRQIIKAGYETTMTVDAVCSTMAPATLRPYLSQQLRWRRSNVVDYLGGISHVFKAHPLVAMYFNSLFLLFLIYPFLCAQALWAHEFSQFIALHLGGVAVFGLFYRLQAKRDSSATDFLPMAVILPLTYGLLTPLAFMTLDSGRWETRNHQEPLSDELPTTVDAPAAASSLVGEAEVRAPAAASMSAAALSESARAA